MAASPPSAVRRAGLDVGEEPAARSLSATPVARSQVFDRRPHLTPMLRQLLLGSRLLENVHQDELWDVVTDADAEPAAMAVAGTSS